MFPLSGGGHGVSAIDDVPATAKLVARLEREYRAACGVAAHPGA